MRERAWSGELAPLGRAGMGQAQPHPHCWRGAAARAAPWLLHRRQWPGSSSTTQRDDGVER